MKYSTTKESYSEVFEIINFLGDEYKNKIPKKLYNFIKNKRAKNYTPNFNLENIESLNEKSISRKAIAILAFLNQKYWCEDDEKIKKLGNIYKEDQERFEEEVIEEYDDEMLCNSGAELDTEENVLPIIPKETFILKLKRLLYRLMRR